MKKTYFLFFVFYSFLAFSQNIKFIDSLSGEPVPFVHLFSNDLKKHFISDSLGVTVLNEKIDTLNVRVLGYYDKKIIVRSNLTFVYLSPKIFELKEVVVSSSKSKFLHHIKPDIFYEFSTKNSISLIKIENSDSIKIKNIGLFVKKKPKGNFIRPHIYEYKNGKLTRLLDSNILKYNYKNKVVLFDLESLNIISDNDLYIGFEFIKPIEVGRINNENNLYFYSISNDKLFEPKKNTSSMSFFIEKH